MHKQQRWIVGILALALASGGCFGSFSLTRKLYHWNSTVSSDRWVREFVFIVMAWVPVYALGTLGDAILFNSIEFWTGNNPINSMTAQTPQTRRLAHNNAEAVLSLNGHELTIEQFQQGHPAGSVRVTQQGDHSVATDAQGHVLFTAQTLPDGTVLIKDANGKEIKSLSVHGSSETVASLSKP